MEKGEVLISYCPRCKFTTYSTTRYGSGRVKFVCRGCCTWILKEEYTYKVGEERKR